MPFALWMVAGSVVVALVALLAGVWPRGLRLLGRAALVVVPLALVASTIRSAETPFGIGDGVVPEVTGRDTCDATIALQERGLRWSIEGSDPTSRPSPYCASGERVDAEWSNPFVEQRPAAGTDLGEGGVVRLELACAARDGCGTG